MCIDDVYKLASLYVPVLIICLIPFWPVWISEGVESLLWQADDCGVDFEDAGVNLRVNTVYSISPNNTKHARVA